jgi:hypothetical protein
MTPSLGLLLGGKLAVVAATTLAGARLRLTADTAPPTCQHAWYQYHECRVLDPHVSSGAFYAPWVFTAFVLIVLSLPTVFLESRYPERGLRAIAGLFAHQTLLVLWSATLPATVGYALGLHACVHTLLTIRWGQHLVGGPVWWAIRFPAAAGIVILAARYGPPVSIVRWPGADSGDGVACATASHLLGSLLPDLALSGELALLAVIDWLSLPCE